MESSSFVNPNETSTHFTLLAIKSFTQNRKLFAWKDNFNLNRFYLNKLTMVHRNFASYKIKKL